MDGIHDLGGREGFGSPHVERDEPVFHAEWEKRALGLTFATAAMVGGNTSQFRHAIERMQPTHYLGSRYYEHWLTGTAGVLVGAGFVTADELEERVGGEFPLPGPLAPWGIAAPPPAVRSFTAGEPVRVRQVTTRGHTRCPMYVRGHRGVVVRTDGPFPLPDEEAHGPDPRCERTYIVRFDTRELWGEGAEKADVFVDLWESYLEPA